MNRLELDRQIRSFLAEDIGQGDLTSDSLFMKNPVRKARLISREPLVAVGMTAVAAKVFQILNPEIEVKCAVVDGEQVEAGKDLLRIKGPVKDLLGGERVALNLVQHLCGIATLTRKYVDQLAGLKVRLTDTRKTTPGLRMMEKYAVRVGGGYNRLRFCNRGGTSSPGNRLPYGTYRG
jgi:nicotinate-nucleotide pyrophosphorylase (carboxylating)